VKDQLPIDQAAQMLDSINQSRAAMRRAIRAHRCHWYLWLWGALWIGFAILGQLLGSNSLPYINGLALIGSLSTLIIAFVQSRQIRAPLDKRFLAAFAALMAFGYLVWPSVLFPLIPASHESPHTYMRVFAYFMLIWMQVYIIAGIWFDSVLLWIGLLISCSILLGLFFFSAVFWLWFAAFGAVPLVLSGFYVRYFMNGGHQYA
jgi:hypothetical protein